MNTVELKDILNGAIQEQFAKSFEKVIENMQNPNTPFKAGRAIKIELKFAQNEKRDNMKCTIQVSEKLASQGAMETQFAVGKDLKTGELYAEEYGKQIKGQMNLEDYEVDVETGEIMEEAGGDNIIDFKARKVN